MKKYFEICIYLIVIFLTAISALSYGQEHERRTASLHHSPTQTEFILELLGKYFHLL